MKKLGLVSLTFAFLSILILSLIEPISSYYEARTLIAIKTASHNFSLFLTDYPHYFSRILYFLTGSFFYKIFSSFPNGDIFSLRLLSVISYSLLAIFLTGFYEKNFLEKYLLGILILFTSYRFLVFVNRIDALPFYIFLTTGGISSAYFYLKTQKRKFAILFWSLCILSFFSYGWFHLLVIPALFLSGILLREKRVFYLIFNIYGIFFGSFLFSLFYILAKKFHINLPLNFISYHTFFKLNSDLILYYFKNLFINYVPYFLLTAFAFFKLFKKKKLEEDRLCFSLFIMVVITTFLLSFTGEKYNKYLLFLYPFLAVFFSLILSETLSIGFLEKVVIFLFVINLTAFLSIQIYRMGKTEYRMEILRKVVSEYKNRPLFFWKKNNPVIVYYYGKPVKVIQNFKELKNLNFSEIRIIAQKVLNSCSYERIIPDPYKEKLWYVLKCYSEGSSEE